MTFDLSSAPIVRLAWERGLNLPADSLVMGADRTRITHPVEAAELTFIRLWDQAILTGPAAVLDAVAACSDDELSDHALMLRLTRDFGGRGHGTQTLYYADDLPVRQPAGTITVSHGNPEAVALESLCPPDDVNDVGLGSLPHKFTLMGTPASPEEDAHDAGPVATSAYAEYQGLLARMGTLVAPAYRRQGLGLLATSIAAHEALAAGLIVQWQADVNNASAHALALSTGFILAGLQTSVSLQSQHR
ncbi:GNAT family N-acetyltransferase [Arthrobacter sp. GMC3]|uniref:GNAT family N-acetyltransferase n=1 Tax=Arthrobacter sp. GMC3 TaxID=2058894 RepID=UPI000CE4395C|nr:N-acetyltransferase [Arthrobacter sp. GMC3]